MNMDMYADMPLTNRIFAGNHLSFHKKKIEGQFGITFWNEQKKNGAVSHTNSSELSELPNAFRFNQNEKKLDVSGKIGFILNEKKESSLGNIINLSAHQNHTLLNSLIQRNYEGQELKFSYSGLYQTNLNKQLTIKSGISTMINQITERLFDSIGTIISSNLAERQIGAFSEFVYKKNKIQKIDLS